MLPLRDNIRSRRWPVVNLLIILINVAVFVHYFSMSERALEHFILTWSVVPERFWGALDRPALLPLQVATLFSGMFMHGGLLHIAGNMWFLWIFGDNVEDQLGHLRYLIFYLTTGLIASASELFAAPHSAIPMLGASGAVAGVLGAYLWWYPRARVQTLVSIIIFLQFIELPAVLFLGLWFLMQILGSLGGEGGVAWYAHIFGFLGGLLLSMLATKPPPRPIRPLPVSRNIYRRR